MTFKERMDAAPCCMMGSPDWSKLATATCVVPVYRYPREVAPVIAEVGYIFEMRAGEIIPILRLLVADPK